LRLTDVFKLRRLAPGHSLVPLALAMIFACTCERQGYSQDALAGGQASVTISGTVANSVTHEPIGRALVYSADERYATFTDEHGHFELNLTQPPQGPEARSTANGQLVLQAKKPGFLSDRGPQERRLAKPGQNDVTLTLVPEALIVGHVKFPSAEAADKVQVRLYLREVRDGFARWTPYAEVRTRTDGEFRFAELRAGEYKLFTSESLEQDPLVSVPNGPVYGFPPRFFAAARDFVTADTIQVHAGETITANLAPERQRYYEVRVPVMGNETGRPPGLEVLVHAQGHRGPGFELGYDPNQNAIRGSLPNGSYTIEAASYPPEAMTGVANIVVANGPVNGPPLTLALNPSIEVNIHQDLTGADSSRIPTASAYVTLQSAEEFSGERGSEFPQQSQGDHPVLAGVKPGRYWVQVQANASDVYAASVTSGSRDLLRTPLVVPMGASVPSIEVTLRNDTGEIEATVDGEPVDSAGAEPSALFYSGRMDPQFQPVTGASVYCVPLANDGGPAKWFNGRVNGRYVLQQVPPGDYRILAFRTPQQLEYRNPAAMRAYEAKGVVVHVALGQKVQVRLQTIGSE